VHLFCPVAAFAIQGIYCTTAVVLGINVLLDNKGKSTVCGIVRRLFILLFDKSNLDRMIVCKVKPFYARLVAVVLWFVE
jgi:hypothetical protein